MIRTEFMMITISMLCLEILMALAPEKINTAVIADETNTVETLWRECELTWDEVLVDGYFVNAYQRHYNHCWEDYAAYIVVDYASSAGLEKEQWELKQIYHFRDDIYQVYTESDRKNELYMLFDTSDAEPDYIVAADIRKTGEEEAGLWNDEYSYSSMLEWYSYEKWFDGEADMEERINMDMIGDLYGSAYGNHSYYAIFDYLDRSGEAKDILWEIDENASYVGRNGEIACMTCIVGTRKVSLFLDIWNKRYAVLK